MQLPLSHQRLELPETLGEQHAVVAGRLGHGDTWLGLEVAYTFTSPRLCSTIMINSVKFINLLLVWWEVEVVDY